MNLVELYVMLGLKPDDNIQNYEIVIRDKTNKEVKNTIEVEQLFDWVSFNLPLNLNKI